MNLGRTTFPVAAVTVRILMAFVLAAGALLVAQDNAPSPKVSQGGEDQAAASILNPPGLAEAQRRYDEDARTNRISLLTPLYTNAPCADVNLRAAALAGDGLAAFNCDGTNDAERSFWRRLAATNGWVPAQLDLASELAKIKPVVLTFRGTNGQEFSTTMPGDQPEKVELTYREYVTNIARPGTTYLRTERQPVEEVSRNLAAAAEWRAKAKAALPKLQADARRKDARALYALSCLYHTGELVGTNAILRLAYLNEAADAGLAFAQNQLGANYESQTNKLEAATCYYRAATQGLATAQLALSFIHSEVFWVFYDPHFEPKAREAVRWAFEAASQLPSLHSYTGCKTLGESYQRGLGVEADRAEAVRWFRRAAEMDITKATGRAEYELALCYFGGDEVPQSDDEGLRWLRVAIARGYQDRPQDDVLLAREYCSMGDYVSAINRWRKLAAQGDLDIQCWLGTFYSFGAPTSLRDMDKAVAWYKKAAERGHSGALRELATLYQYGRNVDSANVAKDEGEALKWYRKAAEQGEAWAMDALGVGYYYGFMSLPKRPSEAVVWFRKAAELGDSDSQNYLGLAYRTGTGVAKDISEAIKWYQRAADQENVSSYFGLGCIYLAGDGVPKDDAQSARWFLKAAELGDRTAQFNLGVAYLKGQGVLKDEVEAYKWLNLAAASGDEDATKLRAQLEREMTPSQVAEAQKLSRDFKEELPSKVRSYVARRTGSPAATETHPVASPSCSGTGFFITPDGHLVTNAHVVEGGGSYKVLTAAGLLPARLIKRDAANDLAVLKVEARQAALPIAPSRPVKLGQSVATLGFPNVGLQGFSPKLARGEIASLAGAQDDARHFQISVPVQPGNSGGPLVDVRGNVVGVIVGKLSQSAALATSGSLAENVNYAIKSGFLLSFLESLPDVTSQLPEPATREPKFEDVVATVEKATVLVLVFQN